MILLKNNFSLSFSKNFNSKNSVSKKKSSSSSKNFSNDSNSKKIDDLIISDSSFGSNPKRDFLFCPVCGSTDLKPLLGFELGKQYLCNKCGYRGPALQGDYNFIMNFRKDLIG